MRDNSGQVSTAELIKSGVLEIGDGYRAKNSELAPTGIPFARAQNLNNGFDFTGADLYPLDALPSAGKKISRPGDCVFTSKGSVGRVGYVSHDTPSFVYSPQLSYWRSLDTGVIEPQYLRYWLQGPEFGRQRDAVKGSTDMADYVNLRDQRRMFITLPSIRSQRKIASILSAYDDLIDNNRRRIRLLDEMAQRIYREWFVDFRYRGHEPVPLVDSELGPIPSGWEVVRTSDLIARGSLAIGDGYRAKNSELAANGLPFVRIGDLREDFQFEGVDLLSPDSCALAGIKISRPGDCVVSTKGTVGKILLVPASASPFVYSPQLSFWRTIGNELRNEYLVGWMRGPDFARQCAAVKGATDMADYVNLKDQRCMLLPMPPLNIQRAFAELVQPILSMVANFWSASANLRSTRDLLLPRLISGEVDVTELDIAMPETVP